MELAGPFRREMDRSTLAKGLARVFVAAGANPTEISERVAAAMGRRWRFVGPLVRRYSEAFPQDSRPHSAQVQRFLETDDGFTRAFRRHGARLRLERPITETQRMRPVEAARAWDLPSIATPGELADCLRLDPNELDWFADTRGLASRRLSTRLEHYRYRVVLKRSGRPRLIEAPKSRLRQIQRWLLDEILARAPAHPAVHGFVRGRSIATFAAPHCSRRVVVKIDLRDFFPSIRARRIEAFFRSAGYPEAVAEALTGLVTNSTPSAAWAQVERAHPCLAASRDLVERARVLHRRPHLPQGAPTSPALANICFWRADTRLAALARSAGAIYTRYADDLAFSGGDDLERAAHCFVAQVAAIVAEEGFFVEHRKTRTMPAGVRQRVAGVVVNRAPSLPRREIEELEAILTNCVRYGPEGQNRDDRPRFREYLLGRIAHLAMLHPRKGARLREVFDRIRWS